MTIGGHNVVKATKLQTNTLHLIMIVFLMVFPHFGMLPMFIYPFVVLGILWFYLKLYNQNFSSIGFRFSDLSFRCFFMGGAIGLAYAAVQFWAIAPLIDIIFHFKPANYHDFDYLQHSMISYILLLLLAAVLVIPYEEIVFRGFMFSKINQMLGSTRWAFVISGTITSVLFALYHYQEGPAAVVSIFIFALFITWLYKVFKGNLWYLISFHLLYDVFMLTAIRLGYL